MINFNILLEWLFPDRRPERVKQQEREFIRAANNLKTLSVTSRGGVSIDPEELRGQIVASREQMKHLVHKPESLSWSSGGRSDIPVGKTARTREKHPQDVLDVVEVAAWRRLSGGGAVRYTCLQHVGTDKYVVAAASLFSGDAESLPRWIDGDSHRQVANALHVDGLQWYATVSEAMDAWDAEL